MISKNLFAVYFNLVITCYLGRKKRNTRPNGFYNIWRTARRGRNNIGGGKNRQFLNTNFDIGDIITTFKVGIFSFAQNFEPFCRDRRASY